MHQEGFKKSVQFAKIQRIRWLLIFQKSSTAHIKIGTILIKIGIVHLKFDKKNWI
jgi:hypothetical protein